MAEDTDNKYVGTTADDSIVDGYQNESGTTLRERLEQVDKVNGNAGDDAISTGEGNDLAAGDMVGAEWSLVDGKWVYNPDALVVSNYGADSSFNDTIQTGDGNDVLLGNGGDDWLSAGAGDDTVNGGLGNDTSFGGDGADRINAGRGDDYSEGGDGADRINAGQGDDVSFGGADNDTINAGVGNDLSDGGSGSDIINAGQGDDTSLGGAGADRINAGTGNDYSQGGSGNDTINASHGEDTSFGGDGNDLINSGLGDDYTEGGTGADTVNAGDGNDVVYGDQSGENILQGATTGLTSFGQFGDSDGWTLTDDVTGSSTISQSANTVAGQDYKISFDLAANLSAGLSSGKVEVLWNGEVVDTVEVTSGIYETFEVTVTSAGDEGALSFRTVEPSLDLAGLYNFDGPIASYSKDVNFGGEAIEVDAFVPGQAKLYQVIGGHLKAFDTALNTYVDVGNPPGYAINAVGFNAEDDLIYGIAKSSGFDSLGNEVKATDVVMMDAAGATYRVGDGFYGDFVGDFDDAGNLWTFHYALNRISVVDVDNFDANGNPEINHYAIPSDIFGDRAYDLAFNAQDGNFYAVVAPSQNGGDGKVVKIDLSDIQSGGQPVIEEMPITGTLYGDTMESGMANGAYGAVFMDGDGNLFYGLNKGDHDLDGTTDAQGAIYKVNVDWEAGQAYSEFMSETQATSSNDGAVDPRSADAFAEVDASAAVLIRDPQLKEVSGGHDVLRGGHGDDQMFGNAGDDTLAGGTGDDQLSGDEGNDEVYGGTGNDAMQGGAGRDSLLGQNGDDTMSGGDGVDYMNGGIGDDQLSGGAGVDKLVGGRGADVIEGGEGNDHMWGGNWWKDNSSDTFVLSAGSGKDMIHDFETARDQIDLSAYGVEFSDVQSAMVDKGWATEIDLSALSGGQAGDKLLLKSVKQEDLDEGNFLL